MRTTFLWGPTNSAYPPLQDQEIGTPAAPYLIDRRNAPLLAQPPRCVPRWFAFGYMFGSLLYLGLFASIGVWLAVFMAAQDSFDAHDAIHLGVLVAAELALCVIAAFFFKSGSSQSWREYQLLRDGRVILGEVVVYSATTSTGFTQPVAGGGEDPWVQVTVTTEYAFTSPSGTKLTGRVQCVYTQTYSEPEVRPGDVVAMLYLDDKTYRVL